MAESTQVQVGSVSKETGLRNFFSQLRAYLIYDPLIWFYTIILGTLSLLSSLFDSSGAVQHGFARLWSRMILGTIGAHVTVEGLEKVDTSKAHVYVVNHLSALDIPALYASLPFQFRILAKRELFRYPFMGWHLRRSGQIPVVLDNPKASIRSLQLAVNAVKNNMSLLVFPEGGRSEDGQLQAFMGGAFFAAIRARTDIVPMVLLGTYETLKMNSFHIKPRPLRLLVAAPISTVGLTTRDTEDLTARTREVIADLYYSHSSLPDRRNQYQQRQESLQ
jgi:1-acyl-sn-glycerol-3-phosphate acyltransferase